MPRYKLIVEYDGRPFAGWQRQMEYPSVQAAIDAAIRVVEPGSDGVYGAGRTDAGVHATGQVAHCDTERDWDPFRLAGAINAHLRPAPICILRAERVPDTFHARFGATERRYLYVVIARRAPLTTALGLAWRVPGPLDLDLMREGAAHLLGHHDFTTFRSTMCQAKSPMKTLDTLDITERPTIGGARFEFRLQARSFLHNQVRSLVGTLERVGAGRWAPDRVAEALAARDRAACGPVAPPDGLYLTDVIYPDADAAPAPAVEVETEAEAD